MTPAGQRGAAALLILATLALGAALPVLGGVDRWLFDLLALQRGIDSPVLIRAAQAVTHIGDLLVRIIILAVAVGIFACRRRWRDAMVLVLLALIASALTDALKAFFARPRPAIHPYISEFSNYSFPSGHASNVMALLLAIGLLSRSRALTATALAVGVAVGVSRVMLDVHWPIDVLGGWLIGGGLALLAASLADTDQRGAMRMAPSRRTSSPLK